MHVFWLHALVTGVAVSAVAAVHLPPDYPEDFTARIRVRDVVEGTTSVLKMLASCRAKHVGSGRHRALDNHGDSFEFIVVGAGAAGCAVAGRVSECGAGVLLLDAGGDPDIRSRVPSMDITLIGSNVDWFYEVVPNGKSCLGSRNQKCRFSSGKALGGGTSINYMMYVRGNLRDLDEWKVRGWTWNDMKPYFLKLENLKSLDQLPVSSIPYHGTRGPMEVEFFGDSENSWHDRIMRGYHYLHFPFNEDVNAVSQIGVSKVIGYVNDGERESAARGYLSPAALRKNLHLVKRAHVISVILDNNNVARGVCAVLSDGRHVKLFASKEVVLSAGAIGTPLILMRSGIGPSQHLKEMCIPVRVNLPVGEGLTDHVLPAIVLEVDRGFGVNAPNLIPFLRTGVFFTKWLATQSGQLASNGLSDATAFVNTACYDFENHRMSDAVSEECELPNIQFIHAYLDRDILPTAKPLFARAIALNDDIVNQFNLRNVNHAFILMSPTLLSPKSRGWVRLNSTKPLSPPIVYMNYLDEDEDVEELLQSIRIIEDLLETKPFKQHGAKFMELELENCGTLEQGSDEFWRCYIREMTHSVYHAGCTTALGRVVDEELRVYGVRRLRVADGGVMVRLPRGNTAALCIAIGEKAADLIIKAHHLSKKYNPRKSKNPWSKLL